MRVDVCAIKGISQLSCFLGNFSSTPPVFVVVRSWSLLNLVIPAKAPRPRKISLCLGCWEKFTSRPRQRVVAFSLVKPARRQEYLTQAVVACHSGHICRTHFGRLPWNRFSLQGETFGWLFAAWPNTSPPKGWCQCIKLRFSLAVEWVGRCWQATVTTYDEIPSKSWRRVCPETRNIFYDDISFKSARVISALSCEACPEPKHLRRSLSISGGCATSVHVCQPQIPTL